MKNSCKFLSLLLFISFISCKNMQHTQPLQLKVMSFNIWRGGGTSVGKTAEVIVASNADIIGIQEAYDKDKNIAKHIADSLGWYSFENSRSQTIITKYPIVDTSTNNYGVKIKIDDKHFVWMFNVHLNHCPYEPYQLNSIEYCGGPFLETEEEAIKSATATRDKQVRSNISDILQIKEEGYPVFLTGDFNEPSFLDWTPKAVEAGLCKISVLWPSTRSFIGDGGMQDSYRTIYPDEVKNPGHTWTPLPETNKYKEVFDRIDFVLFSGVNIKVINSQLLGEESPLSDIQFKYYPSDHRAVLSTFVIDPKVNN